MNLRKLSVLLLSAVMIFPAAALAGDIENSRLLPEKKVAVYEDGKKIADYSEEMPVPEGKVLAASGGRCAVRLGDVSMIAEDQSRFSVESDSDYRYLSVAEGTVYFGLTDSSRSMVFLTPKGAVSSEQVMLNASSENRMLEGYVDVTDEKSEVGVINGGSMVLASADGQQKLNSGQSMLLAQADGQSTGSRTPPPAGWWGSLSTIEKVGVAAIGAVGVGGAAYVIADDDDDDDASPSTP